MITLLNQLKTWASFRFFWSQRDVIGVGHPGHQYQMASSRSDSWEHTLDDNNENDEDADDNEDDEVSESEE